MKNSKPVDVITLGNPYEWRADSGHKMSNVDLADAGLSSQKALLWHTPYGFPTIAVVAVPPKRELIQHMESTLGVRLPRVISPERRTLSLCSDLLNDDSALSELLSSLDPSRAVHLAPYMLTPGVEKLADHLISKGFEIIEDVRKSDLVTHWSSKSNIELEAYRLDPEISEARPRCFVATDEGKLRKLFRQLYADGFKNVVVKTSLSAGGAGVFFVSLTEKEDDRKLDEILETRGVNSSHIEPPFLVEEEIPWVFSPSLDLDVRPNGDIDLLGAGIQRLYDRRYYAGFLATVAMFREPWFTRAHSVCRAVARAFHRKGFVGPLNFDLVVTPESRVVLIETNVRRSALCDGYGIARILGATGAVGGVSGQWSEFSFADYVEARETNQLSEIVQKIQSLNLDAPVVVTSDAALSSSSVDHRWSSLATVGNDNSSESNLAHASGTLMGLSPLDAAEEIGRVREAL